MGASNSLIPFDRPLETIAVWLSSDGDDSGSKFTVAVEDIRLETR